jgi:antitoxin HigA-1
MSRQFNPPHPGEILREDVLPALGLTVTDAAECLGVTRAALSRVLNGHAAISAEMALRLEKWLGTDRGGRADLWLGQQTAYDLWQARKAAAAKIRKVKRLPPQVHREHAAAKK